MTSYIRAYSLGKRLSRAHFMEKHALLPTETMPPPLTPSTEIGSKPPLLSWRGRATGKPKPYMRSELSNKRPVDKGVAGPSMQERYDSARDYTTPTLERMITGKSKILTESMSPEHRKIMTDELNRRRHGGTGSYSKDLSTVQGDVNKLQEAVRNAYTPQINNLKSWGRYQDLLPNQARTFMSERSDMEDQVGDLSEGLTLGRRPVNVLRPKYLATKAKNYEPSYAFGEGELKLLPERDVPDPGARYHRSRDATVDTSWWSEEQKKRNTYGGGQQVNPSAYVLNARPDPRNPREGYTNPITAAHEYGHGEYGMDEVEADALAATTDYDMYDLADFYNRLTDHGADDASTEDTYEDHEARGDTHLPVAERMRLLAGNVDNTKMDKYYDRTER
jgi:hypothetical protein